MNNAKQFLYLYHMGFLDFMAVVIQTMAIWAIFGVSQLHHGPVTTMRNPSKNGHHLNLQLIRS
jgi:hypothetical protein